MTKSEMRQRVHWTKARSDNAGPEPRQLDGMILARREILKKEVAMLMQADSRRKTGLQKLSGVLDALDGLESRFGGAVSSSGRPLNKDLHDIKHRLGIVKVVFTAADSGLMQAQAVMRQRRHIEDGVWDPHRELISADQAAVQALEQEEHDQQESIELQRAIMHEELKAITSRVDLALDLDLVLTSDLQGEVLAYRESHHRAYGDFVTLHARITENTSDLEQWQARLSKVQIDGDQGVEPLRVQSTGLEATDGKEGYQLDEFVDNSERDVTSLLQATTKTRNRMQALLNMLRAQGVSATEKVGALEDMVRELQGHLADLQAEFEQSQLAVEEKKEELHSHMEQEKAVLRKSLEAEMALTIAALDRKEQECHTLKERAKDKDDQLARHEKESKLMEQRNAKHKSSIAELTEKLDDRDRTISRLNMQVVSVEQQLKTMFSKHRIEMEGYHKKVAQAKDQNDELRRMAEQAMVNGVAMGGGAAEPQRGGRGAPQAPPAQADNRLLIAAETKIAELQHQIIESLAEKKELKEQVAALEKSVTNLIKNTSETLKDAGMSEKHDELQETVEKDEENAHTAAIEAAEAESTRDDANKSVSATIDEIHARKMAHDLAMAQLQRDMSVKQKKSKDELENEWNEVRQSKAKLQDIEKELQARAKASVQSGAPALEKTISTKNLESQQNELQSELAKARMKFREQLKEDRKKMEEELKSMKKQAAEEEAALKNKLAERQKMLEEAQRRTEAAEAALKLASTRAGQKSFKEPPRTVTTLDRVAQMASRVAVAQSAVGELHTHLEQKHKERVQEQEKTTRQQKAALSMKRAPHAVRSALSAPSEPRATPPPEAPKSTTPSQPPPPPHSTTPSHPPVPFIRSPTSTPRPPPTPTRQGSTIIATPIPPTTPRPLGHATTLPSPSAPQVGRVPEHPSEGPPALWLPEHAAAFGGQHRAKTAALSKAPAFSPRGPSGAKNMPPADVAELQTARGERPSTARARMEGGGAAGGDGSRPLSATTPQSAAMPRSPHTPESFPEPPGDTHFSSPWHTSSRLANSHPRRRRPATRQIWNSPGGEVLEGWMSSDDERYDVYNAHQPHQPHGGRHAGKTQRPMSAAVHGAASRRPQSAVQRRPVSARVPETRATSHHAPEAPEPPAAWSPSPQIPPPSGRTPRAAASTPDSRFATPSPLLRQQGAGPAARIPADTVVHPSIVTFVASPGRPGTSQSPGSGMRGSRVPGRRPASGTRATRVGMTLNGERAAWQAATAQQGAPESEGQDSQQPLPESGPAPAGIASLPSMPEVA